ncbi:HEPN/Toprim-associated domain-containing protein [Novosphingobium sp.]|uniref:HEPN/Toprim-associated domain-containing protein n=1 Tax=Novosphingobium sp. TaxID=1874826 RepID=UPI003D10A47F
MGTAIELEVGDVSICYAKNHMGMDFGYLFQPGDETRRKSDAINYDYYEEHPEEKDELVMHEAAFARPLSRVLPRLLLSGSSIDSARFEYEAIIAEAREMASYGEPPEESDFLTFAEYCALVRRYPLSTLGSGTEFDDKEKAKGRLAADEDFARLPWTDNSDSFWSESSFFAAKLAILSPESMLHVVALNPGNLDADVKWEFGPLVVAGWASREHFKPGARRMQKILIATEGASDARIIKRALDILRPEVADFFNFVDVDERHHFWGTGNLVKFAEGLLRIDVQNKVLFVLDNDAEGVDAYRKLNALKLPGNMRSMLLPDLDNFRSFPTRGPEGVGISDINGRGAAIECYLDLNLPNYGPAQVLWSNYKRDIDAWHGALEFKESYQRHFYDQAPEMLLSGAYDVSKLLKLLDALIEKASLVYSVT